MSSSVPLIAPDPLLTSYAQGLSQQLTSALARVIAPRVPVAVAEGRYKKFDDKNAFTVINTKRGIGGKATVVEYTESDGSYNCAPHALDAAIDQHEIARVGDGGIQSLRQNKTRTLISVATLSHEYRVLALAHAVTAETGKGVWSNPDVDPIAEMNTAIIDIATATGTMPNNLVIGLATLGTLHSHPKVKDRLPSTAVNGLNPSQLAQMLINPGIRVSVGTLVYDTKKRGATANKVNMVGSDVYVFISQDSPSQDDPSWMKCFMTGDGNITSVRTYIRDDGRVENVAVDWTEDVQITGSTCGKRIEIS